MQVARVGPQAIIVDRFLLLSAWASVPFLMGLTVSALGPLPDYRQRCPRAPSWFLRGVPLMPATGSPTANHGRLDPAMRAKNAKRPDRSLTIYSLLRPGHPSVGP